MKLKSYPLKKSVKRWGREGGGNWEMTTEEKGENQKEKHQRMKKRIGIGIKKLCFHNNMDDAVDIHHAIEKSRPEHS